MHDEWRLFLQLTASATSHARRGCTSVEQSTIGGCAHLLSFVGSDTMSAAYYAQFVLNGGRRVAQSIPATEHSVMTAWPSEKAAIEHMIENFGSGIYACVMDSYDCECCSCCCNSRKPVVSLGSAVTHTSVHA